MPTLEGGGEDFGENSSIHHLAVGTAPLYVSVFMFIDIDANSLLSLISNIPGK